MGDLSELSPRSQEQFRRIMAMGGIRGAEDETTEEREAREAAEAEEAETGEKPKNPHGFTPAQQRQLDRMLTKEKREGRTAAEKELLTSLGIESKDDLAAVIKAHKEKQEAEQDDVTKATATAAAAKRGEETARQELARVKWEQKADLALIAEGIPPKQVARVRGMLTDVDYDADEDTIADAVTDLKEDFPTMFGGEEETDEEREERERRERTDGKPPHSDPGRQRKPNVPPKDSKERAKSLVHERHPQAARNQS